MDELAQPEDERWMREALELAKLAGSQGEVPVGAILVVDGVALARCWNRPIALNDPSAHAEMLAIREAAAIVANYRLPNSTLYSTLEPCAMCAGVLVHARVERLVFGCRDLRFGGVRSKFRLADSDIMNHRLQIVEGVLAAECAELLESFFRSRR